MMKEKKIAKKVVKKAVIGVLGGIIATAFIASLPRLLLKYETDFLKNNIIQ